MLLMVVVVLVVAAAAVAVVVVVVVVVVVEIGPDLRGSDRRWSPRGFHKTNII
jgi:hypothetical protein